MSNPNYDFHSEYWDVINFKEKQLRSFHFAFFVNKGQLLENLLPREEILQDLIQFRKGCII